MHLLIPMLNIPATLLEWTLTNAPAVGVLLATGLLIWKYISWLNDKFERLEARFLKAMDDRFAYFDKSIRTDMTNSEKSLKTEMANSGKSIRDDLTNFKEVTAANFRHMEQSMNHLEKRMDKSESNFEKLFERQHKTELSIAELKKYTKTERTKNP